MLQAFRRPDEWLTSAELSRRANLPEASGYRLIQTLGDIGAVVRGPRGRYRPGMLLVSLSQNVAIGELLGDASRPIMLGLASQLELTVQLGMLEDGMVNYVAKWGETVGIPLQTRVGSQLEAYCSGLGKVLLAAMTAESLEEYFLGGDLVALTPNTITDRTVLRHELKTVKVRGFAVDNQESTPGLCCVAVPVLGLEDRPVAALSATDCAENMACRRQEDVVAALQAAASLITNKILPVCRS